MRKGFIKNLLLLSITCTSLTLISCSNTTKKITVSENTEDVISLEESEIIKAITTGEKLLDENNFEEAKEYFNKAITLEKENKDTYIRIKDKYIASNKLDEAFNIIKTAISNNVDVENMNLILEEISSKFEVIKISDSIYQDNNYVLPKEVIINASDASVSIPVTWNNENVDTKNIGTYTYEGYNDEYGRKVLVELTIMENTYESQYGYLKDIKTENGQVYMYVDLIEYYSGSEALPEAIKDGKAGVDENGNYFLPAPIWIRNNDDTIISYQVVNDATYYLSERNAFTTSQSSLTPYDNIAVSYDVFSSYLFKHNEETGLGVLITFDLKNNQVVKVSQQFRP